MKDPALGDYYLYYLSIDPRQAWATEVLQRKAQGFHSLLQLKCRLVKNSLTLEIKAACGKRLFACRKPFITDTDFEAMLFQVYEGEDLVLPKFIQ